LNGCKESAFENEHTDVDSTIEIEGIISDTGSDSINSVYSSIEADNDEEQMNSESKIDKNQIINESSDDTYATTSEDEIISFISVTTERLNVREDAGIENDVVYLIDRADTYFRRVFKVHGDKMDEESQKWLLIEYDIDKFGWIASWYTEPILDDAKKREIALEYAEILNSRSYDDLLDFLQEYNGMDEDSLNNLLLLFNMLYGDSEIVDVKLYTECDEARREYLLIYDNGSTQEVIVTYNDYRDSYRLSSHTISYCNQVCNRMNSYINVIMREDWEEAVYMTAPLWIEEEIIFPEYDEGWLDQYKETFDLNTIDWKITGYSDWEYECTIFGTKDDQYKEHQITIYCADGLIGQTDDFLFKDVKFYEEF